MGEARTVRTTCPYCGVGCGILATPDADGTVSIKGDPDHPANYVRLCSKGSALGETFGLEGRLLEPQIDGRKAGWNEALELVASRFNDAIAEYGPDSVAFYVSGQILTEDYYVANKLMKGYIGSANIDTNSRLCMASSVAGHRRAFGTDTVPGSYEDLEQADLLILVGSNLAWCHPVIYQRIAAAKKARPNMRVVLIDPRATMTASIADTHLAIKPDGDAALFVGLLNHLDEVGAIDTAYVRDHTTGFVDALHAARNWPVEAVAAATGLRPSEIAEFYRRFAATEKVVTVYSQGVNQSSIGTDKVNAIINCHLATGRIGQEGMGPFSVTGQPNAMGGREVGGLANMLACHMDIENPQHRDTVQRFWQSPHVPDKPGLKAVDLFKAVGEGKIKAVWIMATNPVVSLPDADAVEAAIKACPFVVVSDILDTTDTIRHAHVKLPAAGWGEKDGTVTNSERMISRQRGIVPLPGEARPDWWIVTEVARRMGYADAFAFESAADIFREYAQMSAFENDDTRDFDIGALSFIDDDAFDALKPSFWPWKAGADEGATRFFATGGFYTPDRKARMIAVEGVAATRTSTDYPLVLNTGRVRDHWHTMTRTALSPRLSSHIAEPYAELNPADAAELGIAHADLVSVTSVHGDVVVRALISTRQARGSVFVPMHWNDAYASHARIGAAVAPVTDPFSGQPASKHVAARVTRYQPALYGFAVLAERPTKVNASYWALAKANNGWRLEFALDEHTSDPAAFARELFGAGEGAEPLAYHDGRLGHERIALFDGARLLGALFLSPNPVPVSRTSVIGDLGKDFENRQARFRVIAGRPGQDRPDPGAIVCSCFAVGVNQIIEAVQSGRCATVDDIGTALKAGTNCGSCKAEIAEIIATHQLRAGE